MKQSLKYPLMDKGTLKERPLHCISRAAPCLLFTVFCYLRPGMIEAYPVDGLPELEESVRFRAVP